MKTASWKQMFALGMIFAGAGAISMPLNLLGAPTSALGLFGFGVVLIIAGLVNRPKPT